MRGIDLIYKRLCNILLTEGEVVGNTKEINNLMFTISAEDLAAPGGNVIGVRGISPSYMLGELLWYFTGRNDVGFISKYGSLWEKLSDDGVTNNSAYGYVLTQQEGFNQVAKIIELLQKDPSSRRAVLNINKANENVIETKDEPCTIALQCFIRNGQLNMTGIMRSNDIWFGLPYDVIFFTELQKLIASALNVAVGSYTHFAGSLHVYDRNIEDIKNVIETNSSTWYDWNRRAFFEYCEDMASEIDMSGVSDVKDLTITVAKRMIDFRVTTEAL